MGFVASGFWWLLFFLKFFFFMMVVGGGCRFAGLRRKRSEFVSGEREREIQKHRGRMK